MRSLSANGSLLLVSGDKIQIDQTVREVELNGHGSGWIWYQVTGDDVKMIGVERAAPFHYKGGTITNDSEYRLTVFGKG